MSSPSSLSWSSIQLDLCGLCGLWGLCGALIFVLSHFVACRTTAVWRTLHWLLTQHCCVLMFARLLDTLLPSSCDGVLCCGRGLGCTESKRSAWLPPGLVLSCPRTHSTLSVLAQLCGFNTARVSRLRRCKHSHCRLLVSLKTLAKTYSHTRDFLPAIRRRRDPKTN